MRLLPFRRVLAQLLLGMSLIALTLPSFAADPLYTAEVRVKSQSPQDTLNGAARALLIVLERVSGDPGVKSRPYLGTELKNAKSLIKTSEFVQKEGLNAAGIPSFGTNMIVEFHPDRVRALANKVGLQYWPEPRQRPLAWLVVDDGTHGPRLVSYKERNAAHALLDRGLFRGIQIVLPKGNAAEKLLVGAIVRKDLRALSVASAAYQGDTRLIGYMRRAGDTWKVDWTFVDGGKVLKSWSKEGTDAFEVMAEGGNGAADALIRRYARAGRPPTPPPLTEEELAAQEAARAAAAAASQAETDAKAAASNVSVVRESFTGVQNSADYSALMSRLSAIPGVRSASTVATTPGGISVDITYAGDAAALRAAIALAGLHSGGSKVIQEQPRPAAPPAEPNASPSPAPSPAPDAAKPAAPPAKAAPKPATKTEPANPPKEPQTF